jgi:tRNA-splicing ligase RtcB
MYVTRKGAIRARVGDMGIIPGSMGTNSYIVEGLGNKASYTSAPHGAGRRMSRGEARRTFTQKDMREVMGDRVWNDRQADKLVDEHPGSYKDINEVMRDSADLAEIKYELTQVLNYKGT